MDSPRAFIRRFAVHGVLWRKYLDFAVTHVPHYLQPILSFVCTLFFFFFAAPARRAVVRNLSIVLPGSTRWGNHVRAFRNLMHFALTIADAANFRVNQAEFDYEIIGPEHLEALGKAEGAILLTAHMGNYDLGAALFARKYHRAISMVRAPEPDHESGQHLDDSIAASGQGAVKIAYSNAGALLAFDLLNSVREGEIVSIQGDRIMPGLATVRARMFGRPVEVPSGPFTLALVAEKPVYPLFVARAGHGRYQIIVHEPFFVRRTAGREEAIAKAAQQWCDALESVVAQHWAQWFTFAPVFTADA